MFMAKSWIFTVSCRMNGCCWPSSRRQLGSTVTQNEGWSVFVCNNQVPDSSPLIQNMWLTDSQPPFQISDLPIPFIKTLLHPTKQLHEPILLCSMCSDIMILGFTLGAGGFYPVGKLRVFLENPVGSFMDFRIRSTTYPLGSFQCTLNKLSIYPILQQTLKEPIEYMVE